MKVDLVRLIQILSVSALAGLSGCSTLDPQAKFSEVVSIVKTRSDQAPVWQRSEETTLRNKAIVNQLLKEPLSAQSALQIALLNHAGLQAKLYELGIAEADLVQAGRINNPHVSYLHLSHGMYSDIERRLLFDIMSLWTLPLRKAIENRHFQQTQLQTATSILEHIAETKKAFYTAIAAQQIANNLSQVKEAANANALLAKRMMAAGNWGKLEKAKADINEAQIHSELTYAKANAAKAREHLIRLLGLCEADTQFVLPRHLPTLPKSLQQLRYLENQALNCRLDVQIKKLEIEGKAKALGLTKATRFINVLELGPGSDSFNDAPTIKGYEINLQVPFFDWGDAKVAKSKAIYMQSVWQLRELAIDARSQVREAYYDYQASYEQAKQYQTKILPLSKRILEENVLRYNGMLISTFDLLHEVHEQMMNKQTAIELHRDFLLAEITLDSTIKVKG